MWTGKKTTVESDMALLYERMQREGLKFTAPRERIARWIFNNHGHFTVDDIIEDFRKNGEKISPATTYRVVQMLFDLALVIEHNFGKETKYYEHTPGHPTHDHMICTECGSIEEFSDAGLMAELHRVAEEKKFTMVKHSLSVYGLCRNCRNRKKPV